MSKTIVALYDEIAVAKQVIEDLEEAGFEHNTISLITNDLQNQYEQSLAKNYAPKGDAVTGIEVASFGTIVGAIIGALVGLAAIMIPDIGIAIVAGLIVAGLAGALAGGITGGFLGILVNTGIAEDEAPYYAEGIRRGGTLISIQTDQHLHAEDIMNRYGVVNVHERSSIWRQAGWKGFDADETEDNLVTEGMESIQLPKSNPA